MKSLIFLALLAIIVSSCATSNGYYRGAGESKNCYQWRMAYQTCGPIH